MAEWLRSGLQSRLHRFDSGRRLWTRFSDVTLIATSKPQSEFVVRNQLRSIARVIAAAAMFALATVPAISLATAIGAGRGPWILSAFFGLDNALPRKVTGICPGGAGQDGMPVVFSVKLDVTTLYPRDFVVVDRSGARHVPLCATTAPANETSEDRTVLLIGQLGDHVTDPPVQVEVVGGLRDEAGDSLSGAHRSVPSYGRGPWLVYAEQAPPVPIRWSYPPGTPPLDGLLGHPTRCPAATVQQVRVTWSGGISAPGGAEVGDAQRRGYTVTLAGGRTVTPFALGDLGDHDNYQLLCLNVMGRPLRVRASAGLFAAPRGDLNPATTAPVAAATS